MCGDILKTVQALKSHEKHCKGKVSKPAGPRRLSTTLPVQSTFKCDICGDILNTPTGLKVHKLSHRK